jgi:hypothetical protein
LRGLGVQEHYIKLERDAWIIVAAQGPDAIDEVIAQKHEQLADPDMVKLYSMVNEALDAPPDDPRVVEVADILERLAIRALAAGELSTDVFDEDFAALMDAAMLESAPHARRVLDILEERGWKGWTRLEQVPTDRLDILPES